MCSVFHKHYFLILICFLFSFVISTDVTAQVKKSSTLSYIAPLLKATRVSGKFQGRGGLSKDYKLFKKALADKTIKIDSLESSMKTATPAGKLYVAMILLKHSPEKGKTVLKSMSKDSTKLILLTGCIANSYTVGKAAKELLEKGSLLSIYPPKESL